MSILSWIENQKKLKLLNAPKYKHPDSNSNQGLWTRCDHCGVILYIKHLKENQRVCFGCGFHLQMNSTERIDHLIDVGTWRPLNETVSPGDPLDFRDQKSYRERLKEAQERTGLQDSVQTGTGLLDGIPIALGVMDFNFMGGSMGSVVGEKITRLIEYATNEGLPLILVCASGGARMQEGIFSLMQMAKISAALHVHQNCAKLLYIAVLTSPTTGGVTASFAMLGDLIFAEPKALIGFAGRRVIEQTLQEQLPDDFQTSEYLLHHGLLDLIVQRSFLKQALSETITLYKDAPLKMLGTVPYGHQGSLTKVQEEQLRRLIKNIKTSHSDYFLKQFRKLVMSFSETQAIDFVKNFESLDQALNNSISKSRDTNWLKPKKQNFSLYSRID
jgi:acetyl-CoA carboxylase carboxyl transferase subunit beta